MPFYRWLQANALAGKPLMLAEFGAVAGPDQAAWFAGIPEALAQLPLLKALVYFDLPAPPANCDWRTDSSPASAAAYRAAGQAGVFASTSRLALP
jgi:hypothetical protein